MDLPSPKPTDALAALLAVAVLVYSLIVIQQPLLGAMLVVWIVALQLAFRRDDRERAIVVFGLGLFVLAGLLSGVLWLYFTNLIVACSAYTIYTLKYAPGGSATG